MTKKEFVLQILDIVQSSRELAPGLKILVQNNALQDSTIDFLIYIFRQAAQQAENQLVSHALEKSAQIMTTIREQETIDIQQNEKDLQELETLFKSLKP